MLPLPRLAYMENKVLCSVEIAHFVRELLEQKRRRRKSCLRQAFGI